MGWKERNKIMQASDGSLVNDELKMVAPPLNLAQMPGAVPGFVGRITRDNFMMNWAHTPYDYDLASGTSACPTNNQSGLYHDHIDDADADNTDGGSPVETGSFAGTECAGWVRPFINFDAYSGSGASGIFVAGTTTVVAQRMTEAARTLKFYKQKGIKVEGQLDAPAGGDATAKALFRDRLKIFLTQVNRNGKYQFDALAAWNEPNAALNAGGYTTTAAQGAQLAEMMRILAVQVRTYSPETIVCMGPSQGGEGAIVAAMLAASAAGISVQGSTGAGTVGRAYTDVVCFHPYATMSTTALADAALLTSAVAAQIYLYLKPVVNACRPYNIPVWVTEVGVSADGSTATLNTQLRLQKYSRADRRKMIFGVGLAVFAAGGEMYAPYSVDHHAFLGPFALTGHAAGANGTVRFTSATPVLDGDSITLLGNSYGADGFQTVAINASTDGFSFDGAGTIAGETAATMFAFRFGLGGFHHDWPSIQEELSGWIEAGFTTTNAPGDPFVPYLRKDRGPLRRAVGGVMTEVA